MEECLAYIQDVASSNLAMPIKEENFMEKLIKKLDEIFAKYGVAEEDIAEVGTLISGIGGGDIVVEGEEFIQPVMGDEDEKGSEYDEFDR